MTKFSIIFLKFVSLKLENKKIELISAVFLKILDFKNANSSFTYSAPPPPPPPPSKMTPPLKMTPPTKMTPPLKMTPSAKMTPLLKMTPEIEF